MKNMRRQLLGLITILIVIPMTLFGQKDEADKPDKSGKSDKWDITEIRTDAKKIEFVTDEGTWMSCDVSPDGTTIVFDLLGDIYTMPITGGNATVIATGPAWDIHPTFSPDGKTVAITSDRDGADNIWIIDLDGSNPLQITKEDDRIMNNPVFTPDGQYIIARKHYRNTRSLGAGEMWIYHISGKAKSGLQITKRRDWQHDEGEPDVSPDGEWMYYSKDISPGSTFQYNRSPYGQIYAIHRVNLKTGKNERIISGSGGSMTPHVSPDGKRVAFIRRVGYNTALFVKDLKSGDETMLYDKMSRDSQEAWSIFGTNAGFSWTPDGANIVVSAQGHFWKINATNGSATQIPFSATSRHSLEQAVRFSVEVAPGKFDVKVIRQARISPDGKKVVFQALGKLYVANRDGSQRKRLTNHKDRFESMPAWSPNGKSILFVTWNDEAGGRLEVVKSTGGRPRDLKVDAGHLFEPSWSRDGKKIVYRRGGGNWIRGQRFAMNRGIHIVDAKGGKSRLVSERGSEPHFNATGDRIYLRGNEDGNSAIYSVDLNGQDKKVIASGKNVQEIALSPDGKWIAFVERYNVYVAGMPKTGKTLSLNNKLKSVPLARLSRDAGTEIHWLANSKTLNWTFGPELYSRGLKDMFAFVPGAPEELPKPDTTGTNLGWKQTTAMANGTVAIKGAKIITMDAGVVIENGTIVVKNGRISAVGPSNSVSIPAKAKVIDATGKTIIPGLIDAHAHVGLAWDGLNPQQNYNYLVNLAFGVTTTHDPSRDTESVFSNSELQKAGAILGPRIYSTGTILYGAVGSFRQIINSIDDARSALRRQKAYGAFSVKSYNQPRRNQRQQVLQAARELGMMVVPEGGSTLQHNLNMILDGHTGIEHNIPVAPLYKDVLTFYGESEVGYTPTLIVSYGGMSGENYWYQHMNVWEHKLLSTYTPQQLLDQRSRRRPMAADDDYHHMEMARAAKALTDAGVKVNVGAHGQLQGLGVHWEMWMFAQGGMTNAEVLATGTINPAHYLGLDGDIGSLAVGKLGDLVILDADPLADIRNTEKVDMVMIGGKLYDAQTLNQLAPVKKTRKPLWFKK